jgi:hypothetical protein
MPADANEKSPAAARQARLAASLRENLKRRKAQQRSRGAPPAEGDGDAGGAAERRNVKDERREI